MRLTWRKSSRFLKGSINYLLWNSMSKHNMSTTSIVSVSQQNFVTHVIYIKLNTVIYQVWWERSDKCVSSQETTIFIYLYLNINYSFTLRVKIWSDNGLRLKNSSGQTLDGITRTIPYFSPTDSVFWDRVELFIEIKTGIPLKHSYRMNNKQKTLSILFA